MGKVVRWCWSPAVAAGILLFALHGTFWAQGKKGSTADKAIYNVLRDVANHGADLFNKQGDWAGCYRVYEGALLTVKPFLAHRPDLQKAIDEGITNAEQEGRVSDRAFALRKVIDHVRAELKSAPPATTDKKSTDKVDKDKTKDKKVEVKQTLWQRLGGEGKVKKIVDEFCVIVSADPKANITRDGKYKIDEKGLADLKFKTVQLISSATGGPLKYTGRSMKEVHKGMGITNAEFNAAKADFKKALEITGVKSPETAELLKIIESTRKDIVEVTKKETKKETKKVDVKKEEPKKVDKTDKKAPAGSLSGKVTLDGQPVPAGFLTLISAADKRSYSTLIAPDGTYLFRSPIPAGKYAVILEEGRPQKGQPAAIAIPERYRNPATSGLSIDVTGTPTAKNINLTR